MSQYCDPTDLPLYAAPVSAFANIPGPTQTAECQAASSFADSKLRGRYALPLSAWGVDLRSKTAIVTGYNLLVVRGYNPATGADPNFRLRYQDALAWFEGIQRQATHPDVTPAVAQPGDPVHDLPQVRTAVARGWQQSRGGKPVVG